MGREEVITLCPVVVVEEKEGCVYTLLAMHSFLTMCQRSSAVGYFLTSNISLSGSRLFRRLQAIWSSQSYCFLACTSMVVGLSESLGTGCGSEPLKWPHQR